MPNLSEQKDFWDAVVAAIKGSIGTSSSASTKIADASIVWSKHLSKREIAALPGIAVAPVTESLVSATNQSYDIGYAVSVAIVQAGDQNLTTNADRLAYWRQLLFDLFHDKRLAGASFVHLTKVEPRAIFDAQAFANNEDVSLFVVRATSRRNNR